MARSMAFVLAVGLLLTSCGGTMSLTEYAEALETSAADASARFDQVNADLGGPDAMLEEAKAAVKEALVISNDLHTDLEALDPPSELSDLHAVLLQLHLDVLAAQQAWADSADEAQSVTELLQSSEAQAALSSNDRALQACSRIQEVLDETAARAVFEDVPWLPLEMSETIEVALGCTPT